MKVVTDNREPQVEFDDIDYGSVFEFNGQYFMSIPDATSKTDEYVNAVNIETGRFASFTENVKVTPKSATVTVSAIA